MMGLYNVVQSCVIGTTHYLRPTSQPIEVDDGVATALVAEGCLEAYQPGVFTAPTLGVNFVEPWVIATEGESGDVEIAEVPEPEKPEAPKRRGRRDQGVEE